MALPIKYENVINVWLKTNYRLLDKLRKRCVEYSMAGRQGNDDFPIEQLIKMFDMMIVQIEQIEKDVKKLKESYECKN